MTDGDSAVYGEAVTLYHSQLEITMYSAGACASRVRGSSSVESDINKGSKVKVVYKGIALKIRFLGNRFFLIMTDFRAHREPVAKYHLFTTKAHPSDRDA